jgi:hypothetical protein
MPLKSFVLEGEAGGPYHAGRGGGGDSPPGSYILVDPLAGVETHSSVPDWLTAFLFDWLSGYLVDLLTGYLVVMSSCCWLTCYL